MLQEDGLEERVVADETVFFQPAAGEQLPQSFAGHDEHVLAIGAQLQGHDLGAQRVERRTVGLGLDRGHPALLVDHDRRRFSVRHAGLDVDADVVGAGQIAKHARQDCRIADLNGHDSNQIGKSLFGDIGRLGAEVAPQKLGRKPRTQLGREIAGNLDLGADDAKLRSALLGLAHRMPQLDPLRRRIRRRGDHPKLELRERGHSLRPSSAATAAFDWPNVLAMVAIEMPGISRS